MTRGVGWAWSRAGGLTNVAGRGGFVAAAGGAPATKFDGLEAPIEREGEGKWRGEGGD